MKAFVATIGLSVALWITGCGQQATQEVGEAVGAAGEAASSAVSEAGEAASSAASEVGEAASSAASAAGEAASDAAESVKESVEEGMAAVTEKASAALAGVEGGPEALKNVTGFFDSAKETLSGITDTGSAQASLAKLGEMGGSLDTLSAAINKLPADAKTALAGVIQKGTAGLQPLIEKAYAIPGVKAIIQPKLDEVLQKLSGLTGQG